MADLEQQAAQFLLRREEEGWSRSDQADLDAWLSRSDKHKAVFWRLEQGWMAADRVASLGIAPAAHGNVAPFSNIARRAGMALAASLLPILVGASLLLQPQTAPVYEQFSTTTGGRKVMSFPDGTQIDLNSDSRIRVAMGDRSRVVLLDRGEAYFEVTHDASRPFHVRVGDRQITDIGTKFAVRRKGSETLTAVLEGEVRLGRLVEGSLHDQLVLKRGDHAISQGRTTFARYDDMEGIEAMLGWRRGMVIFDRVALSDAAAEFNRYNTRKLVIEGDDVAAIRIGGSFRPDNVQGFARLMSNAYGLHVEVGQETIKISRE